MSELSTYVIATGLGAVALLAALGYYMAKLSILKSEYRNDKLRLELESRIAELSSQLQYDKDRFNAINHLLLDAQASAKDLFGNDSASINSNHLIRSMGIGPVRVDPQLVFVLTPFNPDFKADWDAIKAGIEQVGLRALRGDEEFVSSNILKHVLTKMMSARLVVANISGRNPNVFYELGIAHSIGKPVVLVGRTSEEIPFDVGPTRVLRYSSPDSLRKSLRNWIVHAVLEKEDRGVLGT